MINVKSRAIGWKCNYGATNIFEKSGKQGKNLLFLNIL